MRKPITFNGHTFTQQPDRSVTITTERGDCGVSLTLPEPVATALTLWLLDAMYNVQDLAHASELMSAVFTQDAIHEALFGLPPTPGV